MWIAHGNTGDFVHLAAHCCFKAHNFVAGERYGDFLRRKLGFAHVHAPRRHFAVFYGKGQALCSAFRFHQDGGFRNKPVVEQKFSHTANGVAAHFRARTVGIVHLHAKICDVRRADEHQTVPADAEVAVGQADGRGRRIGHRLGEAVDIDIVIAAALHFCKLHFGHLLRGYEPARIGKTKPTWKGGNLMAIILIRTLIIFLALIVAMRLMGKRQLGELELSELVVAVLIADIASIPLQNPSLPLSYGLIPLLVLFCCELIFSGLTYKSIHLRKLLYGRPNFIIERGRIAQQAMHRNRFTLDELTQELRNQGILDIASVEYAVLETNGQLNIILAPAQQPVTAEQMHMETEDTGYFSILINNGRILRDNLKRMGRDERWLQRPALKWK